MIVGDDYNSWGLYKKCVWIQDLEDCKTIAEHTSPTVQISGLWVKYNATGSKAI